jgi:TRAP transporter TAXI family solute receptor
MKKRNIILSIVAFGLALLPTVGIAQVKPKEISLRFAAAEPGGAWYPLAVVVSEIMKEKIPGLVFSIEPGGGFGSAMKVGGKKAEVGFSTGGTVMDGIKGIKPFPKAFPDIRAIATLHLYYLQVAVLKGSGINSVKDLRGKTVSVGHRGQMSEYWAKTMLELYGIDPSKDLTARNLGFTDTIEGMKDGHLDAYFLGIPMPYPPMMDLSFARPMALLNFDEDKIDAFCKKVEGFAKVVIPKKDITYKGDYADLMTAGTPLVIITHTDVPEDLVYKMTKAVTERVTKLEDVSAAQRGFNPKNLALDVGIPFHPGALKRYKELGWR